MLCGETAFLCGRRGRVAHGSVGIDVLSNPSEAVLVRRAQMLVALLHLGGLRREQLRLGHVDEVGPEMKHQRGLDVAGVNAMAHIEGGIETRRQTEAVPLYRDGQPAEPYAQIARYDADHIGSAA